MLVLLLLLPLKCRLSYEMQKMMLIIELPRVLCCPCCPTMLPKMILIGVMYQVDSPEFFLNLLTFDSTPKWNPTFLT